MGRNVLEYHRKREIERKEGEEEKEKEGGAEDTGIDNRGKWVT